jgi:peroxiredoxin
MRIKIRENIQAVNSFWPNRLTNAKRILQFRQQILTTELKNLKIIMPIPVGSKAPDFTLKSKSPADVDVKLSNNFGRKNTVLLFFPLAFTGVCTKEMCDLTAGLDAYAGLGADVIAVSVDSPFAQAAWAKQEKIGITLASDLNKMVIKQYDVVFPMLAGVGDTAARAAFVIDKSGVVQYSEQTPTPKDLPNFEAVKAVLAKLK